MTATYEWIKPFINYYSGHVVIIAKNKKKQNWEQNILKTKLTVCGRNSIAIMINQLLIHLIHLNLCTSSHNTMVWCSYCIDVGPLITILHFSKIAALRFGLTWQMPLNFAHNLILPPHIKFMNFITFSWFTSKPRCMVY